MNDSRGRNRPPLSLRIPEPPARPGEEADFSHIQVTPAGVTPRPDSFAAAHDLRDMAFGLVRVLDDAGKAVGPWDPRLSPEALRTMLRDMALTRAFDNRMFRAQRQGKTSFYMKCTGEEAVAVAQNRTVAGDDACLIIIACVDHREVGQRLAERDDHQRQQGELGPVAAIVVQVPAHGLQRGDVDFLDIGEVRNVALGRGHVFGNATAQADDLDRFIWAR